MAARSRAGALMVQGEQALEHFRVRERERPAVCRKDRRIQLPMRFRQPARAGIVEIRERAALQFLRVGVRRIEPGVPLLCVKCLPSLCCFHWQAARGLSIGHDLSDEVRAKFKCTTLRRPCG